MKGTIFAGAAVGTIAGAALLAGLIACEEKKNPALLPAASSLASSAPPTTSAKLTKLTIDPKSTTSLSLEAPKEHIKATTNVAAGTLDVDLQNLVNSRGEIKIDLSTLTTKTFPEENKNQSQTMHARTWLEVADGEEGPLDAKVKEANRWAVYAIRAIENQSAADVTKVPATADQRKVTMTTRGDILIHGRKAEGRTAEVEATFLYDPGAPADKPKGVTIKSTKPFRVVLAEHDVKPRDGFGKIAKQSFHLLGTKVADNADISLDLRATAQP
jgi:polyisoprenoid-binding protein YceI